MTRVIANDTLRNMLHDFSQPVEICDESGKVLCRVFPAIDLSEYEPWEPPMTAEEWRQLEESNEPRYTTAEVLKYLEGL